MDQSARQQKENVENGKTNPVQPPVEPAWKDQAKKLLLVFHSQTKSEQDSRQDRALWFIKISMCLPQ